MGKEGGKGGMEVMAWMGRRREGGWGGELVKRRREREIIKVELYCFVHLKG